jgi:hypothetical protein
MKMRIENTTPIHVVIAVCFALTIILCMTGNWFPCFYLATLVITLYMVLGSIKNGKIDTLFLIFPISTFFVLWVIGFTLAQYYAVLFNNIPPSFTILGFHPSFFWVGILYWMGGLLTLATGLVKLSDRWLSAGEWDAFKKAVEQLNGGAVERKEEKL